MNHVFPALAAALVLTSGCSPPTPDDRFEIQVQGHYFKMIDRDAWPSVITHAHAACDQLASGRFSFGNVVGVLKVEGQVDSSTADAIARSAVTVYCPDQAPEVPPAAN